MKPTPRTLPLFLALLAGLALASRLAAAVPSLSLSENYEIRQKKSWLFKEPLPEVLASEQEVYPQITGPPVLFQVRVNTERPDLIYYTFINAGADLKLERKGNYVIRRSLDAPPGQLDQVKIFLTSGSASESAIRLSPGRQDGTSLISVSLYGKRLYHGYHLPYRLSVIAQWPFAHLVEQTREWLDWGSLLGNEQLSSQLRADEVLRQIRPLLPLLSEAQDGAVDQHGRFVRIATGSPLDLPGLNCSGFVKWVIDGIYHQQHQLLPQPALPTQTNLYALKQRQVDLRGQLNAWNQAAELQRDPYFGLDWSRALAAEVVTLTSSTPPLLQESDVREVPFFHYYEDVGYQMEDLDAVLYLETMNRPGSLYIATVNGDYGEPARHQYYHLAVLVPTINEQGDFNVHVLDTTEELTLARFQRLRPNTYVHLNAIRLPYAYARSPLPQPYEHEGYFFDP